MHPASDQQAAGRAGSLPAEAREGFPGLNDAQIQVLRWSGAPHWDSVGLGGRQMKKLGVWSLVMKVLVASCLSAKGKHCITKLRKLQYAVSSRSAGKCCQELAVHCRGDTLCACLCLCATVLAPNPLSASTALPGHPGDVGLNQD